MDDSRLHFGNLTIPFKYLQDLAKTAKEHNVRVILPIVVDPEVTAANFTVAGAHDDVVKFVQKYVDSETKERKLASEVQKEIAKHEGQISKEDVTDIKILANSCKTVEEFLSRI